MLSFPRKQIMVSLHRNQVFEIPLKSKNNLANVLSIPKNQHGKWKKGGLWHLMFTSSCTIWQLCKFVFTSSCTKLGNHRKVVCEKKGVQHILAFKLQQNYDNYQSYLKLHKHFATTEMFDKKRLFQVTRMFPHQIGGGGTFLAIKLINFEMFSTYAWEGLRMTFDSRTENLKSLHFWVINWNLRRACQKGIQHQGMKHLKFS